MQAAQLSSKDADTMRRIFRHPASHNLEWRDVTALIEHLGTVEEVENRHLTFTVNGATQSFRRTSEKDVSEVEQVLDLRRFLERAGIGTNAVVKCVPGLRLVGVINQQEALIFRTEDRGAIPVRIHPHDPHRVLHHLDHTEGGDRAAQSHENATYYEAIAEALAGADEVLLMGNGTGGSNAMIHLKEFLQEHHPQIANRLVGAIKLDLEALSEGQLLAEARGFFAHGEGRGDSTD